MNFKQLREMQELSGVGGKSAVLRKLFKHPLLLSLEEDAQDTQGLQRNLELSWILHCPDRVHLYPKQDSPCLGKAL